MAKITDKDLNRMIIRNNAARLTYNYESLHARACTCFRKNI
jgi:mannose/fructose/N-acetylgalactosamine-specific phosphotransferase system component IID